MPALFSETCRSVQLKTAPSKRLRTTLELRAVFTRAPRARPRPPARRARRPRARALGLAPADVSTEPRGGAKLAVARVSCSTAPPLLLSNSVRYSCWHAPYNMAGGVTVASAEEIIVYVPLTPHQESILPFTHRQYCVQHLVKVTLSSGTVGWGEGSQYSGLSTQQKLDAAVGQSPGAIMYDDGVGVPLQMALFDAVGRELGCPVHALLPGVKQREWVPLSWWCHSNSPEEWVVEAKLALEHGYTTCKYKARPWWDIVEQVEAVAAVVPPDFKMVRPLPHTA